MQDQTQNGAALPSHRLLSAWSNYSGLDPIRLTLCRNFEAGWNAAIKAAAECVPPGGDRESIRSMISDNNANVDAQIPAPRKPESMTY